MALMATVKGYLKSGDSVLPMCPKITTIGQSGCNLIIDAPDVDPQHSVIELTETGYVLQDLNSTNGTYVNDCRVQNASVRLASGDIIRFGCGGSAYELLIEQQAVQFQYPPSSRPVPAITTLQDSTPIPTARGLPYLRSITPLSQTWMGPSPVAPLPKPPINIRRRPLSAENNKGVMRTGDLSQASGTGVRMVNGVGGGGAVSRSQSNSPSLERKENGDTNSKIAKLNEEVNRLLVFEAESLRKDQLIEQLRTDINGLQMRVQKLQANPNEELQQRMRELDNEVQIRNMEVAVLKEQLDSVRISSNAAELRDQLNNRIGEVKTLKNELERVKKDKNITSGLVTQLQRDMSNKDTTISRLTREIESLKRQISEKGHSSGGSGVTTRTAKLRESKKAEEEREARDRELVTLRQKFKNAENRVQEHSDQAQLLRNELDSVKREAAATKQTAKTAKSDGEQLKSELEDLRRAERTVRVDLEQSVKRYERFRNRVIQVAFSVPGVKAPEIQIGDEDLLAQMKKVIDERTDFNREVADLKKSLLEAKKGNKQGAESQKRLKHHVEQMHLRLVEQKRRSGQLRQEIQLFETLQLDTLWDWVKELFIADLQHQLLWHQGLDEAIEMCGWNPKTSAGGAADLVREIAMKMEGLKNAARDATEKLADSENRLKVQIDEMRAKLQADWEQQVQDAVGRSKFESDEHLKRALEETRLAHEEALQAAVEEERAKTQQLYADIENLRTAVTDKSSDEESAKRALDEMRQRLEEALTAETNAKAEVASLIEAQASQEVVFHERLGSKEKDYTREMNNFRESVKQHSLTICKLEERLQKVMQRNKELSNEADILKRENAHLKSKPRTARVPSPKPRVVVQRPAENVQIMEQTIMTLRQENAAFMRQLRDQERMINSLRADLSGASARLSDITGELSEQQRDEMEQVKLLAASRERELVATRQELTKVSKMAEKQQDEIRKLNSQLGKERTASKRYKQDTESNMNTVRTLEDQLEEAKQRGETTSRRLEEETKVTSELSAIGAQCRGERHEQVIRRQREALSELRQRIKELERIKPPLPTDDQATHHILLLKKELAELRAQQAIDQDVAHDAETVLDREIARSRGYAHITSAELDREKGAHEETRIAFRLSEDTYLSLLRAMAMCVEMDPVPGLRSMGNLPKDEREKLKTEREKVKDALASRIEILKEKIIRKDQMLENYEINLARLRQNEELVKRKEEQVETLISDVRTREEESGYLRELLQKSREQVDQERRLNRAIKQRKSSSLNRTVGESGHKFCEHQKKKKDKS